MKKQILNLGKALNKAEQRTINGGHNNECFDYYFPAACAPGGWCCNPDTDVCETGIPLANGYCW